MKQRLNSCTDTVGKTISACRKTQVNQYYEAIVIEFTDDSEIILIGGGYDGFGDYLRVADENEKETP